MWAREIGGGLGEKNIEWGGEKAKWDERMKRDSGRGKHELKKQKNEGF